MKAAYGTAVAALLAQGASGFAPAALNGQRLRRTGRIGASTTTTTMAAAEVPSETDAVIVGSGLAGLCCGALLSHNGIGVTVLESHSELGGACHTWERHGYHFESGPSLYSGFSSERSPNPLKGIFGGLGCVECAPTPFHDQHFIRPPSI